MRRDAHSAVLAFGHANSWKHTISFRILCCVEAAGSFQETLTFAMGYGTPVCVEDVPFLIAARDSQLSLSVWELVIGIAGCKTSTVKKKRGQMRQCFLGYFKFVLPVYRASYFAVYRWIWLTAATPYERASPSTLGALHPVTWTQFVDGWNTAKCTCV